MLLLPADYWMGVLALAGRETQDFASLQGGIFCYCQRIIEWVYLYGLLVRRKILRLYWADAVGLMWWSGARGVLWLRRDV